MHHFAINKQNNIRNWIFYIVCILSAFAYDNCTNFNYMMQYAILACSKKTLTVN